MYIFCLCALISQYNKQLEYDVCQLSAWHIETHIKSPKARPIKLSNERR